MTEMVDTHLELELVARLLPLGVHHAGVVDQQIDVVVLRSQFGCRRSDRLEGSQVDLLDRDLSVGVIGQDRRASGFALLEVPDCQHDRGASARQLPSGLEAQPRVRAGDDRGASGLVGNVLRRPSRFGHGTSLGRSAADATDLDPNDLVLRHGALSSDG